MRRDIVMGVVPVIPMYSKMHLRDSSHSRYSSKKYYEASESLVVWEVKRQDSVFIKYSYWKFRFDGNGVAINRDVVVFDEVSHGSTDHFAG